MAKIKKEEIVAEEAKTSNGQLTSILKSHKDEHYNYQERVEWKISTGSLLLDTALGSGLGPSLVRICGSNNEGKTQQTLEICRNFLETIDGAKVFWVIAEGRGLSKENQERCTLKFVYNPDEWVATDKEKGVVGNIFVLESNVFELFIKCVKDLVTSNPDKHKYCFVVDSIDGLQLRDDKAKEVTENNRVAGTPMLSKKMLQSLSLGMFKYGHMMILISQVTSEIKLDPYAKTANRGGNFSGGNSLLHGADWILEWQSSYNGDYILDNPAGKLNDGKSKPVGKWSKVILQKSAVEASRKQVISYPIKFGRKPSGIWKELEISESLLMWGLVKKAASWLTLDESLRADLKPFDENVPEKIQGLENLNKYLESNPKIVDYLFERFKNVFC